MNIDGGAGSGAGASRRWSMAMPPADESDELCELLLRCGRRDSRALEQLYVRVAPRLLGCLVRILHQRDRAEDALQDVFVQVWQRAAQFDPLRGQPLAWMMSMARYRAIDLLRSSRAVRSLDDDEGAATRPGDIDRNDPADEYVAGHSTQALERCFARLSVDQQRCLLLAYFEGLSHDEVAGTVRSPLGTVKSWIRRGLESLRECMTP
jgi:RNA polymerase sigma-70 factor (ECF subfamily)